MQARQDIVIDETNLNPAKRIEYYKLAKKYNYNIEIIILKTSKEECITRRMKENRYSTPEIWKKVITGMDLYGIRQITEKEIDFLFKHNIAFKITKI